MKTTVNTRLDIKQLFLYLNLNTNQHPSIKKEERGKWKQKPAKEGRWEKA